MGPCVERRFKRLSAAQTHSLVSTSSSSSRSTDSDGGTAFDPGVVKKKVTLFFGCSLCGLHSTRCFHLIAQRLTTLWRCLDLCRTQADFVNLKLIPEVKFNTHTYRYTPALGCAAWGSSWCRSCEQRRWGCTSRPPSAAGLCRPVQLGRPALASCAALWPTASTRTTPAAGQDGLKHVSTSYSNLVLSFAVREECSGCYLGLKSEGPVPERSLRLLSFPPSVLQLLAGRKPKSWPC